MMVQICPFYKFVHIVPILARGSLDVSTIYAQGKIALALELPTNVLRIQAKWTQKSTILTYILVVTNKLRGKKKVGTCPPRNNPGRTKCP